MMKEGRRRNIGLAHKYKSHRILLGKKRFTYFFFFFLVF